jgi:serine/threonine protein kinase
MKKFDGSKNFPKNFGYVCSDRKVCIYQEQARSDLTTYTVFEGNKLSFADQVSFVTSVVDALLELEANRIYHRDIRADNVLVFEDPLPDGGKVLRFLLTDLGLSHSYDDKDKCLMYRGVLDFFSPEMVEAFFSFQKFSYSQAQELWSLGVLLQVAFSEYMHPVHAVLEQMAEIYKEKGLLEARLLISQFREKVDELPASPRHCSTLQDIQRALLQKNPASRMSLQRVREAIPNLGKPPPAEESSGFCIIL